METRALHAPAAQSPPTLRPLQKAAPRSLVKIDSALLEKSSASCQLKFMKTFLSTLIERLSGAGGKTGGGGSGYPHEVG